MIRKSFGLLTVLAVTGCATMLTGEPREVDVSTVAVRVAPDVAPTSMAEALFAADSYAALVTGPVDSTWLAAVAERTGYTLSGPAVVGDGAMGFLGSEPVGDTTVVLGYEGGDLTVHDALYQLSDERYLDLMAFRVADGASARPAIRALLEYMATDVMNNAAVVMAVEVPSTAAGDSVARMLSPAYYDAIRCDPGVAAPSQRRGLRLFYGPEARVYCRSAVLESDAVGEWVRTDLTLGRR